MDITEVDVAHGGEIFRFGAPRTWGDVSFGSPYDFLRDPTFHSGNTRSPLPEPWMAPGQDFGPGPACLCKLPQASHAAGAAPSVQYVLRTLGSRFQIECPVVGRATQVWNLPARSIQVPAQHDWRLGARVGKDNALSRAQRVTSLSSTPPAAWKASAGKVTEFLHARGQVGYPPSITTDAQFGKGISKRRDPVWVL